VAAASLTAGSLAAAGPASAEVTATTSTGDVVLFSHCQQHPIHYDLSVGPLTPGWRVELQVFDPNGISSEGVVLNSAAGAPTSGTFTQTFCGSEPAGTWTVRGTVRYEPLLNLETPLPDTTFLVRPAATRTTLAGKQLGPGRYRLTPHVRVEGEDGFVRGNGVDVRLERLVHGQWTKVHGTTLTTVRGAAPAVVRARAGTKVRAVVPQENNLAGSSSRPLRL
jgi:hypothetical protein